MKVKFIRDCSTADKLILNEIYESDLCMDSEYSYFINGHFFPKDWFQII